MKSASEMIARPIEKTRALLQNIWAHDFEQRLRMRRQAEAAANGLGSQYDVGTYPKEPDVNITYHNGGLKSVLAAGALAASGLGGYVLGGYLNQLMPAAPSVAPAQEEIVIRYHMGDDDQLKFMLVEPRVEDIWPKEKSHVPRSP